MWQWWALVAYVGIGVINAFVQVGQKSQERSNAENASAVVGAVLCAVFAAYLLLSVKP